jgi:hypothetical protein
MGDGKVALPAGISGIGFGASCNTQYGADLHKKIN